MKSEVVSQSRAKRLATQAVTGASKVWITRVQDEWLPLPAEALKHLGWIQGTEVEMFPIAGTQQIIIRRRGYNGEQQGEDPSAG